MEKQVPKTSHELIMRTELALKNTSFVLESERMYKIYSNQQFIGKVAQSLRHRGKPQWFASSDFENVDVASATTRKECTRRLLESLVIKGLI